MRLLDTIAQVRTPILVQATESARCWKLPGSEILAPQLRACPLRYVLHDEVTDLCTKLGFEDDTILGSCMELLRVPAPNMWIEFRASARRNAFSEAGRLTTQAGLTDRQRIGLLISSDERGRKGQVDVCWDNIDGLSPEVSPFVIEFDLDDEQHSEVGSSADDGAAIGVDVAGLPALRSLFARVRFKLRPQWYRYYIEQAASDVHYRDVLHKAVRPTLEDMPFLSAFCLLLMSGGALRQQPAQRDHLNRVRAKRGRPPLLDHIELTMNLDGIPESPSDMPYHYDQRSSPRLHFVRGHLVRRGDAVFWRTSHMRGKPALGSIRSRTVSLKIASGQFAAA